MKICMLISTSFPPEEGIGFYVYNLSKNLIKKGHDVTVITRGSFKTEYDSYDGIKIIKVSFLPVYPLNIYFHGKAVNKLLKSIENQFDLIHIHFPLTPIIKTSLPMICTLHGSMIDNFKNLEVTNIKSLLNKIMAYTVTYPIFKQLLNQSEAITTVSLQLTEELKNSYKRNDVIFIGNGVDVNKFTIKKIENDNIIKILYVGRMIYDKGIMDLLNVIKTFKEWQNFKFYLIGKGDLEEKIKDFINKENINNAYFLGNLKQDKIIEYYQNSSLFVFPSYYEGFPTVVLEAMSSGLPVILSDIPAHKAFIDDYVNGIFFNKGSDKDLSKKIKLLVNDKELRMRIALNARKTVLNKYNWNKIVNKFEGIYKNLIS